MRHYHRGGAIAPLLGDRYVRGGEPRPFHEFRLGRTLEELEVPTPAHIGAAVYRSGVWYRGDLVTRYVPDSRDLAAVLFPGQVLGAPSGRPRSGSEPSSVSGSEVGEPGASPEAAMRATGVLIRLLHDRGVRHPDLNLKNILIAGVVEPRALALDLDGARLEAGLGTRARRRMLNRFWRSVRKWEAAAGRSLERSLGDSFRAGYGD